MSHYKSPYIDELEVEEGGSLFSGIGTLAKSGINFISKNKDIISNVAKGIGGIGSAASSIAQAVKSSNELEQLQRIEELRNKALESKKRKLTAIMKKKLAQELDEKSGSGFVRVD